RSVHVDKITGHRMSLDYSVPEARGFTRIAPMVAVAEKKQIPRPGELGFDFHKHFDVQKEIQALKDMNPVTAVKKLKELINMVYSEYNQYMQRMQLDFNVIERLSERKLNKIKHALGFLFGELATVTSPKDAFIFAKEARGTEQSIKAQFARDGAVLYAHIDSATVMKAAAELYGDRRACDIMYAGSTQTLEYFLERTVRPALGDERMMVVLQNEFGLDKFAAKLLYKAFGEEETLALLKLKMPDKKALILVDRVKPGWAA
ncbi:MAG: hypothetical protein V1909_05415, partial [Candidatus Micrarchaeota archaeon]